MTNQSAEIGPRTTRRNMLWSAINHFFVEGSMTLSDPGTVLPLMIVDLGASHVIAGLVPSLRFFGWLLPQFFVAGWLQRLRRFLPVVRMLESVRIVLYLILAALIVWLAPTHPELLLSILIILFVVTRMAAGSSAVARAELVARIVPQSERATLVSLRSLTGDIGGVLAGLGVSYLLAPGRAPFPSNYAWLMGISGVAFFCAVCAISLVIEPGGVARGRAVNLKQQIRRTPSLLRNDRRFALYVSARAAATGLNIAEPFYILFAVEILGAPPSMAGLYLSARMLMRTVSNLIWARTCKRQGNLWTFRLARILGLLAPLAVLGFSLAHGLWWRGAPPAYAGYLFALVFAVQGLGVSCDGISRMAYLYDIAPEADRPSYFGLSNTVLGPLYFLPTLGGILVSVAGYAPVFALAALFSLAGYLLSLRMLPTQGQGAHR
jgi:MFS family permease